MGAAGLVCSVLVDQQRPSLLLVPLPHHIAVTLCSLDVLGGVDHAGIGLGAALCLLFYPPRWRLGGAGRLAPGLAHPFPNRLGVLGRVAVLGAGLASAEPPRGGKSATCSSLALGGGQVGRAVCLGLHS